LPTVRCVKLVPATKKHEAAVAAVQEVLPLPWKEASVEAVNAIAYATRYHSEWFWQGAQHAGKRRD